MTTVAVAVAVTVAIVEVVIVILLSRSRASVLLSLLSLLFCCFAVCAAITVAASQNLSLDLGSH